MGTITPRPRKDGSVGYRAEVVRKRGGMIVLKLVETFDRLKAADAWIEKKEKELDRPGALEAAIAARKGPARSTLGDAIDRTLTGRIKEVGRTTRDNLRIARRHDISTSLCEDVESRHIVDLAKDLLAEGRDPATVGNILSSLGKVFTLARPAWGFPLSPQAMPDALAVCRELGLVTRSARRKRRPELEELDRLMEHFEAYEGRRSDALPMRRLSAFGIFGMRRLGETCRLLWTDYEPNHKDGPRILVRDMKHPGEKKGNDVRCRLTPEAVAIIEAMPRIDERIFPYSSETASTNFTRACEVLRIEDLEYRDFRRDGISRMLEMGRDIAVVREFSGHRTLSALDHYVSLKKIDGDKYKVWRWLAAVTEPLIREAAASPSPRRRGADRSERRDPRRGRRGRPSGSSLPS
jgi:integrase